MEGMSKEYIHYGHDHFDPQLFNEITNRPLWNKPAGGLWASPVNAPFGWKDWCEREEFKKCSESNCFRFVIKPEAQILTISSSDQLKEVPKAERPSGFPLMKDLWVCMDFEKLLEQGYDAVEAELSKDWQLYYDLYGWDCDSIVILNPYIVQTIKN